MRISCEAPEDKLMKMQAIPVSQATSRQGILSLALGSVTARLGSWRQRRRHSADLALLMGMEPHILEDIGVHLAETRGANAVLKWHPAVLATTLTEHR